MLDMRRHIRRQVIHTRPAKIVALMRFQILYLARPFAYFEKIIDSISGFVMLRAEKSMDETRLRGLNRDSDFFRDFSYKRFGR